MRNELVQQRLEELELSRQMEKPNKNRLRALKAWETMRNRGFKKAKKKVIKYSGRTLKGNVRDDIIKIINKKLSIKSNEEDESDKKDDKCKILTLETNEYLFVKEFSKSKFDFFIAESNKEEYIKMLENKPDNVFLHYGSVSEMSNVLKPYDVIYLDFCGAVESEKPNILKLMTKISRCKLLGFTFCLRGNQKNLEDYKFDLINKIQELLGLNLKVIYGKAYRDGSPMITLFFENLSIESKAENISEELFKEDLVEWFIETLNKKFPYIWSPKQLIDFSATRIFIKWNEKIWDEMFDLVVKEHKIYMPYLHYDNRGKYLDLHTIRECFNTIIYRGITEKWKRELCIIEKGIDYDGKKYTRKREVHFGDRYYSNNDFPITSEYQGFLIDNIKELDKCSNPECKDKEDINGVMKVNNKNYCICCFYDGVKNGKIILPSADLQDSLHKEKK